MSRIFEITEQIQDYAPKADIDILLRAYVFAAQAHAEQRRSSGELYITHPLSVAAILASLHMDVSSIVTGLLHDTVEDTHVTLEDIEQRFGRDIAHLVDGVTKIGQIEFKSTAHKKAENFRKMIVATAKDVRVLIVKLADRMHNMRTLGFVSPEKARRVSQETMDLYVPLAHRLGIHWIKQEMEDIAFSHLEPEAYQHIVGLLQDKLDFFQSTQVKLETMLQEAMSRQGLEAQVQGRMKHLYSLHEKMQHKKVSFDEIYDIVAFRIIVQETSACYHGLGVIHSLYRPIPGRFKDYIALPKPNGYQSLHTSIIGPRNHRIEVQIRTHAMHQHAEDGMAAHFLYKAGASEKPEQERRLLWVKQLTELLQDTENPEEFLESVRLDLFIPEVYVFSRDGDFYTLPRGARPLDFAYAVHTDVGHHCIGARINGIMADLHTKLRNGDEIEILTSPDQEPSRNWLRYVKSSKARHAIRHYFRQQDTQKSQRLGQEILRNILSGHEPSPALLKTFKCQSCKELEIKVGKGSIPLDALWNALSNTKKHRLPLQTSHYLHYGAECCRPIPGDAVLGCIIKNRGMELHDHDCPHILEHPEYQWLDIDWHPKEQQMYPTPIEVHSEDSQGMLSRVSGSIAQTQANIHDINMEQRSGEMTHIYILVDVRDRTHLAQVLRHIRLIDGVIRVKRKSTKRLSSTISHSGFGETLRGIMYKGRRTLVESTKIIRGKSS